MPGIKDQLDPVLHANLQAERVPLISQASADQQGIRIAHVVLDNMMPNAAMQSTEKQWGEAYCSDTSVAVRMSLAKFDGDCRQGVDPATGELRSRTKNLQRYTPLSQIETPVNILIITGDNLEVKPYEGLSSRKPIDIDEIRYGERLHQHLRWGERNAAVTIVSCLASHFTLHYFHDIPKKTLDRKIFGVYEHAVLDEQDPIVRGIGNSIVSPHSRWGNVTAEQIEDRNKQLPEAQRLKILAASPDIGWLILKEVLPNGNIRIFLQGHPEYDRDDLKIEYERDAKNGQSIPKNYFPGDDPKKTPNNNWDHGARVLNHNILRQSCKIAAARTSVTD